jgi:hypothetical protein
VNLREVSHSCIRPHQVAIFSDRRNAPYFPPLSSARNRSELGSPLVASYILVGLPDSLRDF